MLDVLMLYAVKLGPIETGEGSTTAYVGFTEASALPPVLAGSSGLPPGTAPAAAWRIAAEHCSGQPRTADPHPLERAAPARLP